MATVADFWTAGVDDTEVVGGPARILASKRSLTTYPELISDVLNLTTYAAQTSWFDLGHTTEPFTSSDGFDATDWESQQAGIINSQVGNWNRTIAVTLMQTKTDDVMDLAHETAQRTTNAEGDEVEYFQDAADVTEYRVVAINLDSRFDAGANLTMDVFPRCKRTGADSETAWGRGDPQTHTLEMKPLPDVGVPNDANWYRITQF